MQNLMQRLADIFIAGDDRAIVHRLVAAVDIGDPPAGFANQQDSRGKVPRKQTALPETVKPTCRNIGQIENGSVNAAPARITPSARGGA